LGQRFATHSAKAGPGLFVQETASVSPVLVMATVPCGQVTEATIHPGGLSFNAMAPTQ
jgi:hypothetical protein